MQLIKKVTYYALKLLVWFLLFPEVLVKAEAESDNLVTVFGNELLFFCLSVIYLTRSRFDNRPVLGDCLRSWMLGKDVCSKRRCFC